MRNQKGITLIALIITIIVLAILAAVSITALTGQNGVVTEALKTSEDAVIAEEKENVTTSYMTTAMRNQGFGTTVDALQTELDVTVGTGKTEVTEVDGELIVKYVETGRSYIAGDVFKEDTNTEIGKIYLNPDEWEYTIDETTNTATITKCKIVGATEVTIPNYIKIDDEDIPVKKVVGENDDIYCISIWNDAVQDLYYPIQKTITKVIVSEGIEELSDGAFYATAELSEIVLPDSLIELGNKALTNCENLTNIIIPNNVTSIGNYAFSNTGLTNLTIPDSVVSLGDGAFSNTGLTNLTIPNSVVSLGDGAFAYCEFLTDVEISGSVEKIPKDAFSNNFKLKTVIIQKSVKIIDDYAFCWCKELTNVTIPDSVTSIGNRSFYRCGKLSELIIPDNVTSIGERAFSSCTSLSEIIIPSSVTSIGECAFESWTASQTIKCRASSIPAGWNSKWDYYGLLTARIAGLELGV